MRLSALLLLAAGACSGDNWDEGNPTGLGSTAQGVLALAPTIILPDVPGPGDGIVNATEYGVDLADNAHDDTAALRAAIQAALAEPTGPQYNRILYLPAGTYNVSDSLYWKQDVTWTDAVDVSVSGTSLTKTSGTGWNGAGAVTGQRIVRDGYIEFTASEPAASDVMLGLTNPAHGTGSWNWTGIDYGILAASDGRIYLYQGGASLQASGQFSPVPFSTGDKLRVSRTGSTITYLKNGVVLYTSQSPSSDTLVGATQIYMSGGTVSNASMSLWRAYFRVIGQNRDTTIVKLRNNTFTDPPSYAASDFHPNAVFYTAAMDGVNSGYDAIVGSSNAAFQNSIWNLTIDVGSGNPGAVGIDYHVTNQGSLKNVRVVSSDPDRRGFAGVRMARGILGPGLIKNVTVEGFDYGMIFQGALAAMTIEHVNLLNQRIYGLLGDNAHLAARDVNSYNTVPAIKLQTLPSHAGAILALIDGNLIGGYGGAAINAGLNSVVYVRNLVTQGYAKAVANSAGGASPPWTGLDAPAGYVSEYLTHTASREFADSPLASLGLSTVETPDYWSPNLNDWVNVKDYGATPDDSTDDTAAIQRAIDSGKPLVFFPAGKYLIQDTVVIRGAVRKMFGAAASFGLFGTGPLRTATSASVLPVFRIVNATHPNPIIIENLAPWLGDNPAGTVEFEDASQNAFVLFDTQLETSSPNILRTAVPSSGVLGDLFLEDIGSGASKDIWRFNVAGQRIFARQFDVEGYGDYLPLPAPDSGWASVSNAGAKLWILGLKTEGRQAVVTTTGMGQTEVLGGVLLSSDVNDDVFPAFKSVDSRISVAALGNNGFASSSFYNILVKEIRSADERNYRREETIDQYFKRIPLYAGYVPSRNDSPVGTYRFGDTLAGDEPGSPTLTAVNPLSTNGFTTQTVFGSPMRVYGWDGNTSSNAGLMLNTTGKLTSTSTYSVELVFQFTAGGGTWRRILSPQAASSDYGIYLDATDHVFVYTGGWSARGSTAVSVNEWHHLAVVVNGGFCIAYLDGIQAGAGPVSGMNVSDPNGFIRLFVDNTTEFADGRIAFLRLYNRALSAAEAADHAGSNPFGNDPPVGTYRFGDTLAGDEPGSPTLTAVNPLGTNGFTTQAVFGSPMRVYGWDGNTSSNAGLMLNTTGKLTSTSTYSVELVFQFTAGGGTWRRILSPQAAISDYGIYLDATDHVFVYTGGWSARGSTAVSVNEWHHLAVVVNGGFCTAYLDGVQAGAGPVSGMNVSDPNGLIRLFVDNTIDFADGRIAFLRLYNRALSAAEVADHAGSSPFGNDPPVGTYRFTDTLAGNEPGSPTLTAVNPLGTNGFTTQTVSWQQGLTGVFGSPRRVYGWDGNTSSNAGLMLNTTGKLTSTSTYSVELVFQFTAGGGTWRRILSPQAASSDYGIYLDATDHVFVYTGGWSARGSTAVSVNEWHHLAVVVNVGFCTAYLDGVQAGAGPVSGMNVSDPNGLIRLFVDNTIDFADGRIVFLRLYNRALSAAEVADHAGNAMGFNISYSQ